MGCRLLLRLISLLVNTRLRRRVRRLITQLASSSCLVQDCTFLVWKGLGVGGVMGLLRGMVPGMGLLVVVLGLVVRPGGVKGRERRGTDLDC